jgi:peptidyl-prolyl cis-trans isomerase SurA
VVVIATWAVALSTIGCRSTPGTPGAAPVTADTWAVVEGHPITREDVDKAYRRVRDPSQALSEEETLTAKLSLLNDLILQELLVKKAGELKLDVAQNELDAAYGDAKKNMTDAQFDQELKRRNLKAEDMREGLRLELLTQKVLQHEVGSKITITDKDISDFYDANRAQFNVPEESYHIAQIAVTPIRDPQIANTTGDDATSPEAAATKVRMLMDRLKAGTSFRDLATAYSEDPESAPRGGDLGFVPISRLRQAPAPLRDAVLNKAPGTVNVVSSNGGHTVVLVVAHELAGQRDLSTPGMRDRISETLRTRKDGLLRAAYLTAIRSDAKIDNYIARRLVDSKGQMPGALLSPPGGTGR